MQRRGCLRLGRLPGNEASFNYYKFWKSVKYLNKSQSSIPVLSRGNSLACTDSEKADMLGNDFSSCFNQAVPPLIPEDHSMYGAVPCNSIPEVYLCSVNEIYHSLSTLDASKATGPDKISAHMLKATARSIAPSVTVLMNFSSKLVLYLQNGRSLLLYQYQNHRQLPPLMIIGLFCS